MKAIILAAGFGTRLYPITKSTPKALLKINGKPLLDYLMDNLSKSKPESVLIVTNNLFYKEFLFWKYERTYSYPVHILNNGANTNEERKGAVCDLYDAVRDKRMKDSDFLVLAGDNYF